MNPDTALLRIAVFAAVVYLGEAEFQETDAQKRERTHLILSVHKLETMTDDILANGVTTKDRMVYAKLWEHVGQQVRTMLNDRKPKRSNRNMTIAHEKMKASLDKVIIAHVIGGLSNTDADG